MGEKKQRNKGNLIGHMEFPTILIEEKYSEVELNKLKKKRIWQIKDIYEPQLRELFQVLKPALLGTVAFEDKLNKFLAERLYPNPHLKGNYVFYPWSGLLLHTVSEKGLSILRTSRTRNLVTKDEQKKLGLFTAGVAGLSFGNGIALALAYGGISNTIKLADLDIIETSNLNRVRVGIPSINELKTTITAREIYEINPYADIKIFSDGLTEKNINSFINDTPKLNVIFDVVDDFSMKVRIRLAAKKAKVPVVMLTSLENSVLVDVERFDLSPTAEIFHGILGNTADEMLFKKMTEKDKVKYAMKIVGPEHVSYRNLLSLSEIGKSLVSRPHLYGTVSIVCGLASYIAKRIALGENIPSIRTLIKFNEILGLLPNKGDTLETRKKILSRLIKNID